MANIECKYCGDLVDVEARTVTLPFVCKWCEESFTPAAAETDDGLVYRVVPEGTPECSDEFEESESLDQFELDTKLIEDLSNQLAEANKQIEIKDARIRVLESNLEEGQSLLNDYLGLLQGLVGLAKTYQFEEGLDGLAFALEVRDKGIAVRDEKIVKLENRLVSYKWGTPFYINISNPLKSSISLSEIRRGGKGCGHELSYVYRDGCTPRLDNESMGSKFSICIPRKSSILGSVEKVCV